MTQDTYELTVGSKYLVRTSEEDDAIGRFVGYAMVGTESAVVISMEGELMVHAWMKDPQQSRAACSVLCVL